MTDAAATLTERQKGHLPELMGLAWDEARPGLVRGRFKVEPHHMAPNGYLHAASVVALADSACGYGSVISLPEGAASFTTIELKANFLDTAREGTVTCEARLLHGGRTTQLWDAEVRHEDTGKLIALFRCTQLVIWPRAGLAPDRPHR